MPADHQVEIAVAGEVGGLGAGGVEDREHLPALHAEALGPVPEDEAAVAGDLRHEKVDPAIVVQVGRVHPARLLVHFAIGLHPDPVRVLQVIPLQPAVEDQQLRVSEADENQVQVAVAIQIRAADAVGA